MNRVYIIIVNWNGWRDTLECLESVFCCDYPDFRVVLCDNGSTDDSTTRIKEWLTGSLVLPLAEITPLVRISSSSCKRPLSFREYQRSTAEAGGKPDEDPDLVLIQTGENLGFAGANNAGLRYALSRGDCSYAWLLNNDTVIDPSALKAMVARLKEKMDAGMCGSNVRYYDRPDRIQSLGGGWHCSWLGLPWHYGKYFPPKLPLKAETVESRMNYVEGCSLLVTREFLNEIGLMCEDYFLYFEETDWSIRGKGRFTLAFASDSIVYHKVGGSIGTSSKPWAKSYICDLFNIRNRLFFTRRYYPFAFPSVYLILVATLIARIAFGQWGRVKMIFRLLAGGYKLPVSVLQAQFK